MEKFSELVDRLYNGTAVIKPGEFRKWALEQVADAIPFDSGIWVSGAVVGGIPITFDTYLHNQPATFMENYAKFSQQDPLREQVLRAPGQVVDLFDEIRREQFIEREIYTEHCRIYGIEHALAIAILDPSTCIFSFLSLYRSDPASPFTREERALKQLICVHLVGADRLNQQLGIRRRNTEIETNESFASCDSDGVLTFYEANFVKYLQQSWPGWQGPSLPASLLESLGKSRAKCCSKSGIRFRLNPWRSGFMVFAREESPLDLLSVRELEVASELAKGTTYKQIAKNLGISPSTVTNHTNAIYKKLGITSKSQLSGMMDTG